jgi:hypothetical protein
MEVLDFGLMNGREDGREMDGIGCMGFDGRRLFGNKYL